MILVNNSINWTPSKIETSCWYDPSNVFTITESSGLVSQLDDLSGNDAHLIQSSGSAQPETNTRTLNNLNVIDFSLNSDWMESNSNFSTPSNGMFAVYQVAVVDGTLSNKNASSLWAAGNASATNVIATIEGLLDSDFNGAILNKIVGGGFDATFYSNPPYNGPSIYGTIVKSDGQNSYGYVDGDLKTTHFNSNITESLTKLYINNNQFFGSIIMDFAMGEMIITPDTSELTQYRIEGYLAHKWGLTANLPSGHPYKNSSPTLNNRTSYTNNSFKLINYN